MILWSDDNVESDNKVFNSIQLNALKNSVWLTEETNK